MTAVTGTLLFLGTLTAVALVLAYRVRQLEKQNAQFHNQEETKSWSPRNRNA